MLAAEHNTNTVKTLTYQETSTQTLGKATITIKTFGWEDEARNRERDREVLTLNSPAKGGQTRHLHYTIDIIFMNGRTYYRSSLDKEKWQTHSGMIFIDRFSQITWKRGRTTIPAEFNNRAFTQSQSGGLIHLQATLTQKGTKGTISFWVSPGAKRYVTRMTERLTEKTSSGQAINVTLDAHYGPFNKPLNIQPPTPNGGTPS